MEVQLELFDTADWAGEGFNRRNEESADETTEADVEIARKDALASVVDDDDFGYTFGPRW